MPQFDVPAIKRISRVVRKVEGAGQHRIAKPAPYANPRRQWFMAEITGQDVLGSAGGRRWVYSLAEVRRTATDFEALPMYAGGITTDTAINGLERINAAGSGVQGNGVAGANLVGTFDIQPLPIGIVVPVMVSYLQDGTPAYTIFPPNGVDGACP
jgi:hypothetical protein